MRGPSLGYQVTGGERLSPDRPAIADMSSPLLTSPALMVLLGLTSGVDKCPIFQTTSPVSPCYLSVGATQDGGPVPPFVYAFTLPHPSSRLPCPVQQSVDPSRRCYFSGEEVEGGPTPAFRLAAPLPVNADKLDENLYVTKDPSLLSFPNPVIVV